jgi:hypothetical protein
VVRVSALLALLTGCAQIFGLDETSGGRPPGLTLQVERVSVGASIVRGPWDLSLATGAALKLDPAEPTGIRRIPVRPTAPGAWDVDVAEPMPIQFDLSDAAAPQIYDFPSLSIKTVAAVLESVGAQPALPVADLELSVALDAPYTNEVFQLHAIGPWGTRALEPPAAGATQLTPPKFAYATMTPLPGRMLTRITAADQLVVLRYTGNQLLSAARVPPFEQVAASALTATMSTVVQAPLNITITPAPTAARYAAARPAVAPAAASWAVRAAPGAALAVDNGPLLHAAAVDLAAPTLTLAQTYGNPFLDLQWPTTMSWTTTAQRVYMAGTPPLPATLSAAMTERVAPASGLTLTQPAPLPVLVSLDGVALSTDGTMIPRPTRAVTVTFVAETPTATMFQLQVLRLVPNAGSTALVASQRLFAASATPRFVIPPEIFEPGALYTLRAITVQGGFPGVAVGDLSQRSLPVATAFLDSGVFQVSQ